MKPEFIIKEVVRFSWEKTKEHLGTFIAIFATIFIYTLLSSSLIADDASLAFFLFKLFDALLSVIVGFGLFLIGLKVSDNQSFVIKDIWTFSGRSLWQYIKVRFVYGMIVLGGFLLLIVPGLIWVYKYMLAPYIAIDQKKGVKESLKQSARLTDGYKWKLFEFGLVFAGINILGLLALGVGLMVTLPMTIIASAYVYRKLLSFNAQPETVQTEDTIVAPIAA